LAKEAALIQQTEFGFKGYDANQASAAFHQSSLTQQDVTGDLYSTHDRHGQPVFLHYGKGYFVTAVYTVEQLHIIATTNTQVSAALQALTAGNCLPEVPESQFGKNDHGAAQGQGSANHPANPSSQGSSDDARHVTGVSNPTGSNTTIEPKTVLQASGGGIDIPNFQIKVCKKSNTEYDLSTTPGIPIGMKVLEVGFSGAQPRLDVTGPIDYFRKAMRYPD